jgi:hypothetical protein
MPRSPGDRTDAAGPITAYQAPADNWYGWISVPSRARGSR